MPEVLDGLIDDGQDVRVAPISHLGKLLGLIVVARSATDGAFRPADEVALADLARTLGLALHNVGLDSALQKSLEELERRNAELQASRTRIVSAADESRRRIERNLHDGAQQHLVALALKVRLLQRKFATDDVPLSTALDVFHDDIQTTIDEVRELAHGIYPPLLRDRGLRAALQASATRSPMPTIVEATEVRFAPDVEAAVYFCCMEAMQNAAKYAGDGATISVTVTANEPGLTFSVQDDGAGFDPDTVRESHGFVNMRDRVGAHGGDISVESSVGHGTTILGNLPVDHMDPQAD
jgi:signal transduction histidine kinase